ncbi:hypothetical protein BCR35DRAFT_350119 [Leucosporidium creatinivorum]|uniref:ABM domain-containing protein n=1 Tax=Leucosporidium creatinivorum TaxID=106004 RepID=A0A1Y2G3R5_9BASI|nr:hypothetical protein BCR35DRAFT_350119 [Leucosporidium creatinivorum]
MSYNKVVQVATLKSKPAQGDRLAALLSAIREHALTNLEPGALEYRLARDGDSFVCWEVYKDQAAIEAHLENPGVKVLFAEIAKGDLLEGNPVIQAGLQEI